MTQNVLDKIAPGISLTPRTYDTQSSYSGIQRPTPQGTLWLRLELCQGWCNARGAMKELWVSIACSLVPLAHSREAAVELAKVIIGRGTFSGESLVTASNRRLALAHESRDLLRKGGTLSGCGSSCAKGGAMPGLP